MLYVTKFKHLVLEIHAQKNEGLHRIFLPPDVVWLGFPGNTTRSIILLKDQHFEISCH